MLKWKWLYQSVIKIVFKYPENAADWPLLNIQVNTYFINVDISPKQLLYLQFVLCTLGTLRHLGKKHLYPLPHFSWALLVLHKLYISNHSCATWKQRWNLQNFIPITGCLANRQGKYLFSIFRVKSWAFFKGLCVGLNWQMQLQLA